MKGWGSENGENMSEGSGGRKVKLFLVCTSWPVPSVTGDISDSYRWDNFESMTKPNSLLVFLSQM